jgi:Na+/melibiose symporter-like transporter
METYYHNSHTIMSLVFVGNAVGFIAAAPLVTWVLAKLGRAYTIIYAEAFLIAAYVMLVCTPCGHRSVSFNMTRTTIGSL